MFGSTVQITDLKISTVIQLDKFDRVPKSGRLLRNLDGEIHCCFVCTSKPTGTHYVTSFEYDQFLVPGTDKVKHPRTIRQWARWHADSTICW